MTDPKKDPEEFTDPAEMELKVEYYPDVDILTLRNGTPASIGASVAKDLMVFFNNDEDEVHIVELERASEVLGPVLDALVARSRMDS